jgi:hypothetical protein
MTELRASGAGAQRWLVFGETLVLFSLSSEALMNAVNQSSGNPIQVDNPLQLILYGAPDI